MKCIEIQNQINAFSGQYEKSFFEIKGYKIFTGSCDIVKTKSSYNVGHLVDYGYDYLIYYCLDGFVIFYDLRINNLGPENSLKKLKSIINE